MHAIALTRANRQVVFLTTEDQVQIVLLQNLLSSKSLRRKMKTHLRVLHTAP